MPTAQHAADKMQSAQNIDGSDTFSVTCAQEADQLLARIAASRRSLAMVENALAEEIALLKRQAAEACNQERAFIARAEGALSAFAEKNSEHLFRMRKNLPLTFGELGFKASTRLELLPGWSWEHVLAAVESSGLSYCLRVRCELDKQVLKGLPEATLRGLGMERVTQRHFVYKTA